MPIGQAVPKPLTDNYSFYQNYKIHNPKKTPACERSFQVPGQKSRFLCKTACSDEGTVYACGMKAKITN
jgi:hypothetical protein